MRKYGILIAAGFLVFILQTTFSQVISIKGWSPDFLIILVFVVTLRFNATLSLIFAFIMGIMQDLFITDFSGISAFSNVLAAYAALFFKENNITTSVFTLGLLVISLIRHTIFFFLITIGSQFEFWVFFYQTVLPNSVYTLVIGVLIFFVFKNSILKEIENEF